MEQPLNPPPPKYCRFTKLASGLVVRGTSGQIPVLSTQTLYAWSVPSEYFYLVFYCYLSGLLYTVSFEAVLLLTCTCQCIKLIAQYLETRPMNAALIINMNSILNLYQTLPIRHSAYHENLYVLIFAKCHMHLSAQHTKITENLLHERAN